MDTSVFLGCAYLLTGWMSGLGGGNSRESHWLGYRTTMLGSGPVSWDTVVIVGKYTCYSVARFRKLVNFNRV